MKAFWTRPCATCGKMIPKDSEMFYADKKAYHPACRPDEQASVLDVSGSHRLAGDLGYIPHDEALVADWRQVRSMSRPTGSAVGRIPATPQRERDPLFRMPEAES